MRPNEKFSAVIMASGKGARLWPLTGPDTRKAFAQIDGGNTLLGATAARLNAMDGVGRIIVICQKGDQGAAARALNGAGVEEAAIVAETEPRGTAVTLIYGALEALGAHQGPAGPVIVCIPVDHWFEEPGALESALAEAAQEAHEGAICAIGVKPERAEPAYGYLQRGTPTGHSATGARIERFVEWPIPSQSESMIAAKQWRWNSGIFAMRASAYLDVMRTRHQGIHDAVAAAWAGAVRVNATRYPGALQIENKGEVPLDGVLWAAEREMVSVELEGRWRDVGSWRGIADTRLSDSEGNVSEGPVYAWGTRNSYIRAGTRRVIAIGVEDIIVVDAPDGVLIVRKGREGAIKGSLAAIENEDSAAAQRPSE